VLAAMFAGTLPKRIAKLRLLFGLCLKAWVRATSSRCFLHLLLQHSSTGTSGSILNSTYLSHAFSIFSRHSGGLVIFGQALLQKGFATAPRIVAVVRLGLSTLMLQLSFTTFATMRFRALRRHCQTHPL